MNKAKRARPLLLEQLEDRSLFAASMMWFVSADHDTRGLQDLDEPSFVSKSVTHQDQDSHERNGGFDHMTTSGRSSVDSNRLGQIVSRNERSAPVGSTQTAVIVIPVFQVTFKPTVDTASQQQSSGVSASATNIGSSASLHSQATPVTKPQAAVSDAINHPGPTPATLNSTFASSVNMRTASPATARRADGVPQAAPAVEAAHVSAGSPSTLAAPTDSFKSAPTESGVIAESNAVNQSNDSTILLVTPSGQPLFERTDRFEWIPDSPHSTESTDEDEWSLPEPTLRDLKALARPSQAQPSAGTSRLPAWFAERTGMIALNAQADLPTAEVIDVENVDVVLGAMMGVNRVITVASSVIHEPLQEASQAELLEAIDEALADKIPLPRESTRLSAMAYPAVAIIASAIAAAKRYRGNGRMEHTRT